MSRKKTNLQVPISTTLKNQAEEIAKTGVLFSTGVSARFIANYSNGNVSVVFGNTVSPEALRAYKKDLAKTRKDLMQGKVKAHKTVDAQQSRQLRA
ncbi:MAG: hypothetical protein ACE5DX_00075 [Candidatus Dojkabacteria bacterium]